MTRTALIVVVGLAAYAVLNLAASMAVAAWWRLAVAAALPSPGDRARQLFWWRVAPGAISLATTILVVIPAFAIFEPHGVAETTGPFVMMFAIAALAMFGASFSMALRSAAATHLTVRRWLRSSRSLDVDPPAGVPAYVIHSASPIVALVGVFRPKLVAAHTVIAACTTDELNAIVAHERGHLRSRDNLKRWLMACAPDALRWTPVHRQLVKAWHDAAEDAADDVTTGASDTARVELVALLVKIARLTPEPVLPRAAISPFVEQDGLSRRVTRLLASRETTTASWNAGPIAAAIGAALIAGVMASPALMEGVFDVVEQFVALGR